MADQKSTEYQRSANALIREINRIKVSLIAKHGSRIANQWQPRARRSTVINEYLGME